MSTPLSTPKITVITACCDQGAELRQTIENVWNQNCPNVEHIVVVSRNSSDESLQIARSFGKKVITLQDDGSEGPEAAYNQALMLASGEILAFLGAGDLYLENTLQKVTDTFIKNSSIKFLSGTRKIVNAELGRTIMVSPMFKARWEHVLYGGLIIGTESVFWQRSLMERAGPYLVKGVVSDYELWCRMLKHVSEDESAFIDYPLSSFSLHDGQRSENPHFLCTQMRNARDAFLMKSELSKEDACARVVKWTSEVEKSLIEFAHRNRQPYLFMPNHSIWFSGWPFENKTFSMDLPEQPDMLKDFLPPILKKIRNDGYQELILCGAGKHSERLLASGLPEKYGLSVISIVDQSPRENAIRVNGIDYKIISYYCSELKQYLRFPVLLSSDIYEEKMYKELKNIWKGPVYRIYGDNLDWQEINKS